MTHIVQFANFYAPTSGGLRTAVDALGAGYCAAGHQRTLVVPDIEGAGYGTDDAPSTHPLPSASVPGAPYRVVRSRRSVREALDGLEPDRVEVHDKLHAVTVGRWARERGVPAVLVSHERLDGILARRVPSWVPLPALVDRWNSRLVAEFDIVVCASSYAAAELERVGAAVTRVPFGVDLEVFHPSAGAPSCGVGKLVMVGRLSREKRPDCGIDAVALAREAGVAVELVVVGDGPMHAALERRARGLPVRFVGHLSSRRALAARLASSAALLAPCPVETFGLSILEALACGTPAIVPDRGAAAELVEPSAGIVVGADAAAFADAICRIIDRPTDGMRIAARTRAEEHPWSAALDRMLAIHQLTRSRAGRRGDPTPQRRPSPSRDRRPSGNYLDVPC